MKLVQRSWKVGTYTVTLSTLVPIVLGRLHHADIAWAPDPGDAPMTEIEEAQYSKGLAEAVQSITSSDRLALLQ